MYTLRPNDIFVISRMFPDASERKRSSFDAEVFRGHLERDGKPIRNLNNISAEVKRVVYAAELPMKTNPPKDLTYILFGKENDLYVAHQIARAPDFDQLMAVQVGGQQFNAEDLRARHSSDSSESIKHSGEKAQDQGGRRRARADHRR